MILAWYQDLNATCNETELRNATDKCAYVTGRCTGDSLINFYDFYFCALKSSNLLFVPIGVISLAIV